jgi:CBS domain-containing protein
VIVTGTDTSIADAAKLMRSFHVGDVVVLKEGDERHPVGLVTDRDIIVEVIANLVALVAREIDHEKSSRTDG